MKLSFNEAQKLMNICDALQEASDALEDIRPGGGFTEYVDEEKECNRCGAPTSKTAELAATTANSVSREMLGRLKAVLPKVKNGMTNSEIFDIRGVIADCIAHFGQ